MFQLVSTLAVAANHCENVLSGAGTELPPTIQTAENGDVWFSVFDCSDTLQISSNSEMVDFGRRLDEIVHDTNDGFARVQTNAAEQVVEDMQGQFDAFQRSASASIQATVGQMTAQWGQIEAGLQAAIPDRQQAQDEAVQREATNAKDETARWLSKIEEEVQSAVDSANAATAEWLSSSTFDVMGVVSEVQSRVGTTQGLIDSFGNRIAGYHEQLMREDEAIPEYISSMEAALDERLEAFADLEELVDESVPKFLPSKRAIWSGGCSGHGYGCGWQRYCLDRQDYSTMGGFGQIAA